jgi:ferredoxin
MPGSVEEYVSTKDLAIARRRHNLAASDQVQNDEAKKPSYILCLESNTDIEFDQYAVAADAFVDCEICILCTFSCNPQSFFFA